MKKRGLLILLLLTAILPGCMPPAVQISSAGRKEPEFQQVNFHQLMRCYMNKVVVSAEPDIEGIYSVSIKIEKKSKPLFSFQEQERVVERKENFAKVAILRDHGSNREFMEISLDKENKISYSVRGEFAAMNDANIMIYKHFEPKGKSITYTFSFDKDKDLLEGVRTEVNGRAEFTYTLTYLKLDPRQEKSDNSSAFNSGK